MVALHAAGMVVSAFSGFKATILLTQSINLGYRPAWQQMSAAIRLSLLAEANAFGEITALPADCEQLSHPA